MERLPHIDSISRDRLWGRVLFEPTQQAIACDKQRLEVAVGGTSVEVWLDSFGLNRSSQTPDLVVLRLPGARGRGELATRDPARFLPDIASTVATVNPPGFGGSPGPCGLSQYFAGIGAAYDALTTQYPGAKIWIHGKSIGGLGALYLAATRTPAVIVVRNVVDPRGIARHFVGPLGRAIPAVLDARLWARPGRCPALFVVSRDDKLARPRLQLKVMAAYDGPAECLEVGGAHDDRVLAVGDEERYAEALQRLWAH
jgi:pimeloyl-ACP methyl ester carboxylesterase